MTGDTVMKSVAKKLYHYLQIGRLEEGFDLSGPNAPIRAHPPLKPQTSLQYPGRAHCSSTDNFFLSHEIQAYVSFMDKKLVTEEDKEKAIKACVERYLSESHHSQRLGVPLHVYQKTRQEYRQNRNIVGHGRLPAIPQKNTLKGGMPLLRRHPPHIVSKAETSRLIATTTKLLATNDMVKAVPLKPSYMTAGRTSRSDVLSSLASTSAKANFVGSRVDKSVFSKLPIPSLHAKSLETDIQKIYPQKTGTHSHVNNDTRLYKSECSGHSSIQTKIEQSHTSSLFHDDTKFQAVSCSDQKTECVGIQTESHLLDQYDYREDLVANEKSTEYRVLVKTGRGAGTGTKAKVKIILYGDKGRSRDINLNNSKYNRICFQKGKEDLFLVTSPHVGRLRKIKIGHDETELSYAWYLESVSVHDMLEEHIYEFICEKWLSGQTTDKQTYRELPVLSDRAMVAVLSTNSLSGDSTPEKSVDEREETQVVDTGSQAGTSMYVCDSQDLTDMSSSHSHSSSTTHSKTESESRPSSTEDILQQSDLDRLKSTSLDAGTDFAAPQFHGPTFIFRTESFDDSERAEHGSTMIADEHLSNPVQNHSYPYKRNVVNSYVNQPETNNQVESDDLTIHEAARNGDMKRIQELTYHFPELLESRDASGWTPLHIASCEGREDVVKWLLASNAAITEETPTGFTAVHLASINGHVSILMILCAMGANINDESIDQLSPLHLASKHGHLACVKWLIANNANIHCTDRFGCTPIDVALKYNQHDVANFLQSCVEEIDGITAIRRKSVSEQSTFGSVAGAAVTLSND